MTTENNIIKYRKYLKNIVVSILLGGAITILILTFFGAFDSLLQELNIDKDKLAYDYIIQ